MSEHKSELASSPTYSFRLSWSSSSMLTMIVVFSKIFSISSSYLTCDGLLNDNDHCLERLSCEFSDPQNIERANKLDRAVSSM